MTAATRYAKALFALSTEHKQQPAVTAAVQALSAGLNDVSLASSLSNPRLTPTQRSQLAAGMAKAVKAPQLLANTLGVLAANNRLASVPAMLKAYVALTDTANGITQVQVSSATVLTAAQRASISKLVQGYTKATGVNLNETLDTRLKGGFRAFFNGQVWDASLSGSIARLETRLRNAISQRHSQ